MRGLWKENLAARVAMATAGLLALVLVLMTALSYGLTALLVRSGGDAALLAAVQAAQPVPLGPRSIGDGAERRSEERRHGWEEETAEYLSLERENRRVQVVDRSGRIIAPAAGGTIPVDDRALSAALLTGHGFASAVNGAIRPGPDWWVAVTPREGESRVLFLRAGTDDRPFVVQVEAPLGPIPALLPHLGQWLALLALAAVVVSSIIAWRMGSRMYRPLRAIAATAGQIDRGSLSVRIPDRWPDRTLKRLVAMLNAMIARLQQAFETQGRFVAAAAHELRGPLAAMRTELEVALRRVRSPEEYRKALEGALAESRRLSDLTEHLLVLARYERGVGLAIERGVLLQPLLRRVAAEAERRGGVAAVIEAPDDLMLDADPIALERVLSNLVRNALQAGAGLVSIRGRKEGAQVVIEVEDNGRGIAPEHLEHLFEPFYRADAARSRDGGVGLGLSIVSTVVEAHDGQVEVRSQVGEGSLFRIRLPGRQPL